MLPADSYPFLVFYGVMSLFYLALGIAWMVMCLCHWRELLTFQFWVAGVIGLGMFEMAMFYADFAEWNSSGERSTSLMAFAVIVSCAKASLARFMVLVAAMGYGVVKPTLGTTMHRVAGLIITFFVVDVVYWVSVALRTVSRPEGSEPISNGMAMFLNVLVSVLDAVILWWVFLSLHHTTKMLSMRRQPAKLFMYRVFTYSILVAALAAVVSLVLLYLHGRKSNDAIHWAWLVRGGTGHLLFYLFLVVVVVLWRPTKNNTRYAYSPLVDRDDDDEDGDGDGDGNQLVGGSVGESMKMRALSTAGGVSSGASTVRKVNSSGPGPDAATGRIYS